MNDSINDKFINAYKKLILEEAAELVESVKSDIFKKFNTSDADDSNFENQNIHIDNIQKDKPEAKPMPTYLKVSKMPKHIGIFHGINYSGGSYDPDRITDVPVNDEMFYVTWEKGWMTNHPDIVYLIWDMHSLMNPFSKNQSPKQIVTSIDDLAKLMDLSKDYSKEYINSSL